MFLTVDNRAGGLCASPAPRCGAATAGGEEIGQGTGADRGSRTNGILFERRLIRFLAEVFEPSNKSAQNAQPELSQRRAAGTRILGKLLVFKSVYFCMVVAASKLWSDFDADKFSMMRIRWPLEGEPVFASHFATWDAAHYLYLSRVGYHSGVPSCAFYPLWPLLLRWISPLLGGSHLIGGLVFSNLFSFGAWGFFHRLVARRWGGTAANWSLLFLAAFPARCSSSSTIPRASFCSWCWGFGARWTSDVTGGPGWRRVRREGRVRTWSQAGRAHEPGIGSRVIYLGVCTN